MFLLINKCIFKVNSHSGQSGSGENSDSQIPAVRVHSFLLKVIVPDLEA